MIEAQKITKQQIFFVIMAGSYGTGVYFHFLVFSLSGRASLAGCFISSPLLTVLAMLICYISKEYQGLTVLQILEKHIGKIFGKAFSFIYALISIIIAVLLLSTFTGLVNTFILFNTPRWFIIFMIMLVSFYIMSKGLEVQARMFVFTEIVIFSVYFTGMAFGLVKEFKFSNLLPLFDVSFTDFVNGTYLQAVAFCENVFVLMIFTAAVSDTTRSKKTIFYAFLLTTLILPFVTYVLEIGILGIDLSSRIAFQGVNIAINISIGDIIQGVQVLLMLTYELAAVIKVTLHGYCAWITCSHVFGDRFRWILFFAIGIIIYAASISINSSNEAFFLSISFGRYVLLPYMMFIIILTSFMIFINRHIKNKG